MSLCSPFLCSRLRLGKGAFRPDLTCNRQHEHSCQHRRLALRSTVEASQLTRKENTRKRHQAQRRKVGATISACMGQDGTLERPRLAVYRSNNHIYAQVIDDTAGHTLAAVSSLTPTVRESLKTKVGANKEAAELVGRKIAELCLSKNIDQVFLDRGGLQYHGRIQALAEAAREGGLLF